MFYVLLFVQLLVS